MNTTAAAVAFVAAGWLRGAPIPVPLPIEEIDLNRIAPQFAGPVFRVASLEFSPDENWIAIGAWVPDRDTGTAPRPFSPANFLFLLPLHGQSEAIPIDPGVPFRLNWSPDSRTVLLQGRSRSLHKGIAKLYDLQGNELWTRDGFSETDLPQFPLGVIYGFLDARHFLIRRLPTKGEPAGIDTTDLEGNLTASWNVPNHWRVFDMNSDRRRLLVFPDEGNTQTLVVDYDSHKILRRKDNPSSSPAYGVHGGTFEYFAEDGKSLCSVGSVGNPSYPLTRNTFTECWDVESGKRIARFRHFLGGAPAAASTRAARLLLTDNPVLSTRDGRVLSYPGLRVVWDFRSGLEVASWRPRLLETATYEVVGPTAISSSGHYIAEGVGAGIVVSAIP